MVATIVVVEGRRCVAGEILEEIYVSGGAPRREMDPAGAALKIALLNLLPGGAGPWWPSLSWPHGVDPLGRTPMKANSNAADWSLEVCPPAEVQGWMM